MMSDELTVADVLERAADLIEPEGAWTQGAYAKYADGRETIVGRGEGLVCWCLIGALDAATDDVRHLWKDAFQATQAVVGRPLASWNDKPDRTQGEVVSKLREAATLARSHHNNQQEKGSE